LSGQGAAPRAWWHGLTAPRALDQDTARREHMTAVVSLIITVMGSALLAPLAVAYAVGAIPVRGVVPYESLVFAALIAVVGAVSWRLARTGHARLGAWSVTCVLLATGVHGNYFGGEAAPALVIYALTIVLTSTVLGGKAPWLVVGVALAALASLHVGRLLGWVTTPTRPAEDMFVNRLVITGGGYVAMAALLWYLRDQFTEALAQARSAAGALQQANAELAEQVRERERAEEEARRLNAELEERVQQRTAQLLASNRELEAIAYSVSHDLRAPLRGMDGFSQVLLEDYGPRLDDTARGHLGRIRANAQRMGALIDDILKLSRVTRAEMSPAPVDVAQVARDVVAELEGNNPHRQVRFDCPAHLPDRADAALLRILLANLLGNAWKFTSRQEVAHVALTLDVTEITRTYLVRDDGAGFDMAYAGKLFGAFQRLHAFDEFEGTGIGLAMVQRIAQRHGGRAWVREAAVGQGATFCFTLGTPS
jgi:signal transduction histidine kinase